MKKILFALLFLSPCLYAVTQTHWKVGRSSQTSTSDTVRLIDPDAGPNDVLVALIVGDSGTSSPSSVTLYNSSGAVSSTLFVLNSSSANALGYYPFFVEVSSGISYATTGAPKITILWDDKNP